ncbi:MAG: hypothetical protein B6I28_05410 [Fusobacteriia bacterium 4572_132]|nr:MAG: hypothetical protein B6I28_05410 [Fusobacteriia bacterium 4572_132]
MEKFIKKINEIIKGSTSKNGIKTIKQYLEKLDKNVEYYLFNKHTKELDCNSDYLKEKINEYEKGITEKEFIYLKYDKSFLKVFIRGNKNIKKEKLEIYLLLEILNNEISSELYHVSSFVNPIYYEVYKIFFEENTLATKKILEFIDLVNGILGIKIVEIRRNNQVILEKKNIGEINIYKNDALEVRWIREREVGVEIRYEKILIILFTILDNFFSKEELKKQQTWLLKKEEVAKSQAERLNKMLEENLYKSIIINNLYKKISETRDLKEAFFMLEKIIGKEIGYDYIKIKCENIFMEFGVKKKNSISEEIKTSLKRIGEEYSIIYYKENITKIEKSYLFLIFNHSKVEIENILLYERIKNLSQKDGITNLYIHRVFMSELEKEIKTSYRQNTKLALVMLDIDNFKRYNDEYGHQRGDEVLFEVAEAIRKNIREIDIPCRYGGEEFIIILPFTNQEKARIVAERIKSYLEEETEVTASFGVTEYIKSELQESFIKRVDMAMYEAKKNGKNCVIGM